MLNSCYDTFTPRNDMRQVNNSKMETWVRQLLCTYCMLNSLIFFIFIMGFDLTACMGRGSVGRCLCLRYEEGWSQDLAAIFKFIKEKNFFSKKIEGACLSKKNFKIFFDSFFFFKEKNKIKKLSM